jgi:CRISPR-associated protein Csm1
MDFYDRYFSGDFPQLRPEAPKFSDLLDREKYLLISGDFFGIQKFIFEGLATKNASKVLRAKSAYIQIFTRLVAYRVCDMLGIDKKQILSTAAGKFEILSPNLDVKVLEELAEKLNGHFIEHFFGLSGIGISWVECSASEFGDAQSYRRLRERVTDAVEASKYRKFSLPARSALLAYDEGLDNASLCRICNLRKITRQKEGRCDLCDDFVRLGERLTKEDVIVFVRENPEIAIFDGWGIAFDERHDGAFEAFDISKKKTDYLEHWPLSSYVKKDRNGAIEDFEALSEAASKEIAEGRQGIEALGVLKADVDDMGKFIRERDVTDSFENFTIFSRALDNFFSIEVPRIMAERYPDTYTVFAGGDDLFLLGAWNEILDLSREIADAFHRYTKGVLTLSFGIVLVKPGTPVNYMAQSSERALEASKETTGKDAITLFGATVKNREYREKGGEFYRALKETDEEVFALPTAFLYRLLDLLVLRQRVSDDFIEGSMWKSKLSYAFRRNVFERLHHDGEKLKRAESLLKRCHEMIEHHPAVTRMVLSEFIYKRRKTA